MQVHSISRGTTEGALMKRTYRVYFRPVLQRSWIPPFQRVEAVPNVRDMIDVLADNHQDIVASGIDHTNGLGFLEVRTAVSSTTLGGLVLWDRRVACIAVQDHTGEWHRG